MKTYIAKDGERLDNIVYKHYGRLDGFADVLACNANLKAVLSAGDVVRLPKIKAQSKKVKSLW